MFRNPIPIAMTGTVIELPTGTVIQWPAADAGRVRVRATVSVAGMPSPVQLELSFKKHQLKQLFARCNKSTSTENRIIADRVHPDELLGLWGTHLLATLAGESFNFLDEPPPNPASRKRTQVLHGHFQGLDYTLNIDRNDRRNLLALMAAADEAADCDGEDYAETGPALARAVAAKCLGAVDVPLESTHASSVRCDLPVTLPWFLLPPILIDFAVTGVPRGPRHIETHMVMSAARTAVVAASLLEFADEHKTPEVLRRMKALLSSEGAGSDATKTSRVLALADRALRPAMEHAGRRPLVEWEGISSIVDSQKEENIVRMFAAAPDHLAWWINALLADEGHVAKILRLVQ